MPVDLPTNLPAERGLLGGLVAGGPTSEATAHCDVDDLTVHAHRLIFQTAVELTVAGTTVDLSSITAHLASSGKLEEAGDVPGVASLLGEGAPVASQIRWHAVQVSQVARRRRVIESARQLATHAAQEPDGLDAAVDAAVEAMMVRRGQTGIVDADTLRSAIAARMDGGGDTGVSTGWVTLDAFYRVPRGMVTVVTGVPGHGKSTVVDCLVANLARLHGWRFAMFSPEQAPAGKHALRLIHTAGGHGPELLGDRFDAAQEWVLDHFTWIDDQHDNTLSSVLSRARLVARRGQLDGLVIDPWNKLAHDRSRHARDDLYIQEALHQLTRFARQSGVHVWVVAHPKQMQRETPKSSRWEVPSVYDISGGSEWNNQADAIVTVWRDQDGEEDDPSVTEVAVQKVRDQGVWGRLGGTRLLFDASKRQFGRYSTIRSQVA